MVRIALAIALVATACAKKVEPSPEGGRCYNDTYCESKLVCHDKVCMTADDRVAAVAMAQREAAAEELRKEKRQLEKSGVAPATEAESNAPAGAGSPVRVVEVDERGAAFAACRASERLVGGGCRGDQIEASYPKAFGPGDTVGARWTCESARELGSVTAYALCQAVPAAD